MLEAMILHLADELVLLQLLLVVFVESMESCSGTAKFAHDEVMKVGEEFGSSSIKLLDGHVAAVVLVKGREQETNIPWPTQLGASLEDLASTQDHGAVWAQCLKPGTKEASILPSEVVLEVSKASLSSLEVGVLVPGVVLLQGFLLGELFSLLPPLLHLEPFQIFYRDGILVMDVHGRKEHILVATAPAQGTHVVGKLRLCDGPNVWTTLQDLCSAPTLFDLNLLPQPSNHVFWVLEVLDTEGPKASPLARGVRINLLQRKLPGPVGIQ
mmetsp:Transcript_48482/g.115444  ORF Transcript_48482/g.115444 Transcript_48482/m.115444 type:complete len:269 (-) Transcript_48482:33-839(-)